MEPALAREHLALFGEAREATARAMPYDAPAWFAFVLAFAGPAAIWALTAGLDSVGSRESTLLIIGAAAMGAIVIGGLIPMWRWSNENISVRPLAPIKGGQYNRWNMACIFSVVLPVNIITNVVLLHDVNQPYLLGAIAYIWLALVPGYAYRRAAATRAPV